MTKCANCETGATYTYAITPTHGIHYCSKHVPKFLQAQKVAGLLPLREAKSVVVEEPVVAPKKTTRKKITE